MSNLNTVAVLGAKELEADIKGSFPGMQVIGLSVVEKARRLMREGAIGLFLTKVDDPKAADLTKCRLLAREAARHDIPALFVAESQAAYSLVREALDSEPIVGVAFGRKEVRPMVNLLRDRAIRVNPAAKGAATGGALALDLDGHPLLQEATSFLRNPDSGRLDAKRIAELYGEPLKRFAEALSVTPAAVTQTPDSKKYQDFLGTFEKVARIIPMLEAKDSFSAWVRTPNRELKGAAPIEWLFGGGRKAQQLAEIVEDVLVGQPD